MPVGEDYRPWKETSMETIEEVIKTISIEHLTQKEFVDVVGQIFKEMGEHWWETCHRKFGLDALKQ